MGVDCFCGLSITSAGRNLGGSAHQVAKDHGNLVELRGFVEEIVWRRLPSIRCDTADKDSLYKLRLAGREGPDEQREHVEPRSSGHF